MDARETEALVQRLVRNPHDQEAITAAHTAGQSDPRAYAMLLEKVGSATSDPAFSSHWLTEAAGVWSAALGDAHRAARALMAAVDRDPTQPTAAEQLAGMYREKGDVKALVALLERRSKALTALAERDPTMASQLATIHEDLGRMWSEAPLNNQKKAIDHYRRAIECDQNNQFAIYSLRELYKAQQQWAEAVPLFDMERRLVDDPERMIALYQDEADVRRSAGDLGGAAQALRAARHYEGGQDAGLKQLLATNVLERQSASQDISAEREEAAQLFIELSEEFPGEHGFSYALCASELSPANDRAIQLALYYGEQLGRLQQAAARAAAYVRASPNGALSAEARQVVSQAMEMGGDDSLIDALGPAPGADTEQQIASLTDVAQALARKAKKNEAAAKYRQVLALDPNNLDAIGFLEPYFRQTRKLTELRDMLMNAARSENADVDQRKAWLKEVATLCETQLRDPEAAAAALRQSVALDPEDDAARGALKRLLEKGGQWDALAEVLEEEAEQTADVETRISIEKNLAKLHEQRRKDPVATGEAWSRIAALAPDDEQAILTAVKHFERAERLDLAARVISDNIEAITEDATRGALLERLGELRLATGDALAAGEALAESASLLREAKLWQAAEQAFVGANAWDQAAAAVDEQAQLAEGNREKAALYALEADYLGRAGDESSAVLRLEQATDLDAESEELSKKLEEYYEKNAKNEEMAAFLLKRAEKLRDRGLRVRLRQRAATLQRDVLGDVDAARQTLIDLLHDGDEPEALAWLANDAEQNGDPGEAAEYLARLIKVENDPAARVEHAMREAALLAGPLDDVEGAIGRYERILKALDPKHVGALLKIAELNEERDEHAATADALERALALLDDGAQKIEVAERLAVLYEGPLDDAKAAIRVLDIVRGLEPENFDAVQRLSELCERVEDWPRVAELLAALIEVEGDEEEVSRMTRRLADILHAKVGRDDEALAALMQIGDAGDEPCRQEYVSLGDKLGWKGIVATKLVEWYVSSPVGDTRNEMLRGAFDRFLEVDREADAASVAKELARTRGADPDLAKSLERIAVKLKDLDALGIAHDLQAQALTGPARAEEFVRQAEVLRKAGVEAAEAVQHGEQALTSVPAGEADALLERLARLAPDADAVIDIFERQVTRCKAPGERLQALARASQVAAERDRFERARQFFDIALGSGFQDETLGVLGDAAAESDGKTGGEQLRRTLAEALAMGGQGSRDGGRTRSAMLGRASEIAFNDLKDVDQAFVWLGDALVAHVDDERLDALEDLARKVGEPRRAEGILSRALEEVFDGPLVRKLLSRRAALRHKELGDPRGAAGDLKRLHDLSPSDTSVMEELSALYTELGDYRGMVQLYEDQILRGKDLAARAELARKVARLWEERLDDPREAADAWRRVLRMKAGDPEATEGLERAKANMLKAGPDRAATLPSEPPPAPAKAPGHKPGADAAPESAPVSQGDEFSEDAVTVPPPKGSADAELDDGPDAPTEPPPDSADPPTMARPSATSPLAPAVQAMAPVAKDRGTPLPPPGKDRGTPLPPPSKRASRSAKPPQVVQVAAAEATPATPAARSPEPPPAAPAQRTPGPPAAKPSRPPPPSMRPSAPSAGAPRGQLPPPAAGGKRAPLPPPSRPPGGKPPPPPGAPGRGRANPLQAQGEITEVRPPTPLLDATDDEFAIDEDELIEDGPSR